MVRSSRLVAFRGRMWGVAVVIVREFGGPSGGSLVLPVV